MNWQNVFDCYPDTDLIYVVDGMPFVQRGQAEGHSKTTGKPVEVVEREKPKAKNPEVPKQAAPKASAERGKKSDKKRAAEKADTGQPADSEEDDSKA
jgi:hypothetical protein